MREGHEKGQKKDMWMGQFGIRGLPLVIAEVSVIIFSHFRVLLEAGKPNDTASPKLFIRP